jgi:hypothetical protein
LYSENLVLPLKKLWPILLHLYLLPSWIYSTTITVYSDILTQMMYNSLLLSMLRLDDVSMDSSHYSIDYDMSILSI